MNEQETNQNAINHLEANNAEEINSGPQKIFLGASSAAAPPSELTDLEPREDVKGGGEHILLARQVGVPS